MNDQVSNEESSMKEAMTEAKTSVKETVRETKDKLRAKGKEVASEARERGEEYVRLGKDRAANRLAGVSASIRQSAERFEQEHDPNIAQYTRLAAEKLERAAAYVREHDLRELRRDGEELVRRHPAIFFGGMFLAGLAAARFLKASAEREFSEGRFSGTEEEAAAESNEYSPAAEPPLPESPGQPS